MHASPSHQNINKSHPGTDPHHAELDDNVLPEGAGKRRQSAFKHSVHEWVAKPGPQTDKAREVVKELSLAPRKLNVASARSTWIGGGPGSALRGPQLSLAT